MQWPRIGLLQVTRLFAWANSHVSELIRQPLIGCLCSGVSGLQDMCLHDFRCYCFACAATKGFQQLGGMRSQQLDFQGDKLVAGVISHGLLLSR